MRVPRLSLLLLGLASLSAARPVAATEPTLVVFAATSLTDVLQDLNEAYTRKTEQTVTFSFAGSSALAHQLEAGEAADVFLPADSESMDFAEKRHLIDPATRVDLLRNRLVLIAPAADATTLKILPRFDLGGTLGEGPLAIADPQVVAAGRYARYALISLGVWNSVSDRLLMSDSVKNTLNTVARREATLGVVYGTDARASKAVRVVDVFPQDSHPRIVYPVALTPKAKGGAARFVEFMNGAEGRRIFNRYGFEAAKN